VNKVTMMTFGGDCFLCSQFNDIASASAVQAAWLFDCTWSWGSSAN